MDYRELILFAVAVFGCLFGVYQFLHNKSKDTTKSATESATNDALLMNELKHIGGNVDEIKTDVKILKAERSKDREDLLILGEHHKSLSDKLNTAFEKLDAIRDDTVTRKEFDSLRQDVEDLKN